MFDLPIPLGDRSPTVKVGQRTRHHVEILEDGPRRGKNKMVLNYVGWAAVLLGAAAGYSLYTYGVSQALPILLIACLVLLYLR